VSRNNRFTLLKKAKYLVSDFDEEGKNDDNEQVVNDANCSDDDVHNLDCEFTDLVNILLQTIIVRRRREIVADITWQ